MIDLTQTHYYAPLLVMLVVFIVAFVAIKKAQVPGETWVLVALSLLVALIFAASTRATNYLIEVLPPLTLVVIVSFFVIFVTIFFVTKDFDPFKKILAWLGFIMAILIILCVAFQQFPTMNHMLPSSSDSHLDSNLIDFKHFIYSQGFKDNLVFVLSIVVIGFFLLKTKK